MSKPVAVLISDVHYNIQTLPLADAAMRLAIGMANDMGLPLIVAGDLHDTKANMRAECVNAMIETFSLCQTECFILRGNHDSINEKSKEHSLNFLEGQARIVSSLLWCEEIESWLCPYYSDIDILKADLSGLLALKKHTNRPNRVIMHQGLTGSNSGEYIQDKSAITHDDVKDFRVISGHYHCRQDIPVGDPYKFTYNLFSYIGNPYTLNYGEANDPPKGFQILMDDGSLEFVPTNLRRHIVWEIEAIAPSLGMIAIPDHSERDLIWVKVKGTKEQLLKINKVHLSKYLETTNFRLDLIPLVTETVTNTPKKEQTQAEVLDILIDSLSNTSDVRKKRLKDMWRLSCV